MINWIKRSPILAYFVLVFGIEWILVFTFSSIISPLPALLIGSWLPDLVGLFVTGISTGRAGLGELFSKVILWRVRFKWYATAVLLPATLACIAIGVYAAMDSNLPTFAPNDQLLIIFLGALFTGALGEELGWRGTALPRMQVRWNGLISSLILGILWGLYHIPSFLMSGLPLENAPIIPFMLSALSLTAIITWTFNRTRGSLIIVFLYHLSFNFIGNAAGIFGNQMLFGIFTVTLMIAAVVIIILDWRNFTRHLPIQTSK